MNTEPVTWVMTHVSPGKHPFLEKMALLLDVQLWMSGHMDPLSTQIYSLFSLFDDGNWFERGNVTCAGKQHISPLQFVSV